MNTELGRFYGLIDEISGADDDDAAATSPTESMVRTGER